MTIQGEFPKADWEADGVRLYLGDCLEILPKLPSGCVDAVVTDPPYGVGFAKYESHDDDPEAYELWMRKAVLQSERATKEGGGLFWWQGSRRASEWHLWFPRGYRILASCKDFVQMHPTKIQYAFDPIVFWFKGGVQPKRTSFGSRDENAKHKIWDWHICKTSKHVNDPKTKGIHPCQRPIDAACNVVVASCSEGEEVLDPFMGSGTTGVACIQTGRQFIGIEKEPKYFEIAVKRTKAALKAEREKLQFTG